MSGKDMDPKTLVVKNVPIASLKPHPRNPRIHPDDEILDLVNSQEEFGIYKNIVVAKDGTILAGHGNVLAAQRRGQKTVPVHALDLDPFDPSALRLMMLDNNISRGAKDDTTTVASLLKELSQVNMEKGLGFNPDQVKKMIAKVQEETLEEDGEDGDELGEGESMSIFDYLFPSSNEWGVPDLDLNCQAQAVVLPCIPWGSIKRTSRMTGMYHLYVDDYRFEALWDDPSGLPKSGCAAVVEPNFSISPQTSRAVALYQVFRKRWTSAYWQMCGIPLFVDANVPPDFRDLNALGVPKGWRSFATRVQAEEMDWLEADLEFAYEVAGSKDICMLVVTSSKKVAKECSTRGLIPVMGGVPEKAHG